MASKGTRISDAAEKTALTGTEKFPISDGSGDAKAVTANTIKQFVGSASGDGKVKDVQVDGTSVLDETSGVANINLSGKVDKETGKGLSTNDYTSAEKSKLAGIAPGATVGATAKQASTITEHTAQLAEITPKISDLERKVNEVYGNTTAEGYIRVAYSETGEPTVDPELSYKHYEKDFGKSVFSIFYPCLVGNKETGTDTIGKILKRLNKLDYTKDVDGNTVAIDGSDGEVLICNVQSYHAIFGHRTVGGVTYDVFLMSLAPFSWFGYDSEEIKPYGLSPDYCVMNDNRMRSVYNENYTGSNTISNVVTGRYVYDEDGNETYDPSAPVLSADGKGLSSTNISLLNGEQYAMNNNADPSKTYPYYNATARAVGLMISQMIAEIGTWYAHELSVMGSGYSANCGTPNESFFAESYKNAVNGMRYSKDGSYNYLAFSAQNAFDGINNYYPSKLINDFRSGWKCLERHRAVAYAIANDVPELTWYYFEGNKYKWRSIPGLAGPSDGEMSCVVFKYVKTKFSNIVTETYEAGNDVEIVYSSAMYHGIITDVSPSWWTSGLIMYQDDQANYHIYQEYDQSKLLPSPTSEISADSSFNFEVAYKHIIDIGKLQSYRKDLNDDSIFLSSKEANFSGGKISTHVGTYVSYSGNAASNGKKVPRGFRRGGSAYNTYLSPLFVSANNSPSSAGSVIGFGICCDIVPPTA